MNYFEDSEDIDFPPVKFSKDLVYKDPNKRRENCFQKFIKIFKNKRNLILLIIGLTVVIVAIILIVGLKRKKKDDNKNSFNNFSYETPKKLEENNSINNSNEISESNLINEEKEKSLINDKKENDFKSNILNKENFNLSFDLTSEVKKFENKSNYKNSLLYTEPKNKYKNIFSNFKF